MNNMNKHFSELKQNNEKAAVFFVTAGDPSLNETLEIMKALAENGADCIELGMPFSDPIADGPIIQRSTSRALLNHVNIPEIFAVVHEFRKTYDTPVLMMGYWNPVMRYGLEKFAKDCQVNGVDGLIIADLPFEEGEEFELICKDNDVNLIYILAPDIDPKRTQDILNASRGFVYVVAQYSTTGVQSGGDKVSAETVKALMQQSELPVFIGFGISSEQDVKQMSAISDGIIIGSWLIKELESSEKKVETAGAFAKAVKAAL